MRSWAVKPVMPAGCRQKGSRVLAYASALAWLSAASLSPVRAEDLAAVYQKAVAQDARMAAASATHDASIEKLPQARSQLLPTLTFSAEKTYSDSELVYEPGSPFESGNRSYYDRRYAASLTQPLFRMCPPSLCPGLPQHSIEISWLSHPNVDQNRG